VHDARQVHWLNDEMIDAGSLPDAKHWRTLEYPLKPYGGTTVGIVIRVSCGGPKGVFNEEALFDEISVMKPHGIERLAGGRVPHQRGQQ
jgi:hypothetical protein